MMTVGCVNTIVPAKHLQDATNVYVVDHGRHASLVMPSTEAHLVRYAYGDWRWYAFSDEGVLQGMATLFWTTPGTLGRREIGVASDTAAIMARIVEGAEEILVVPVAAQRVTHLRQKLDAIYQEQFATRVYNQRYDLVFVRHPTNYSLLNNSNSVMVGWLEELGCEVHGAGLLSTWRLGENE